ncbi:MAG: DUF4845 domain-containing protein [Gammaproteobacteria bacterium]|jgi:hypothetical protein|nr:DUF4845 domain-containing protein [Gammaproteobacteria bacterium]
MRAKTKKSMRGVTVINMLVVAIVIVFAVVIAINLIPPYLHNFAVKDAIEELAKNPDAKNMTKAKIKDLLSRKLQVNYIKDVSPDALVLEKKDGKTILTLKYEVRVHLIGNIDAVLMFNEEAVVGESSQ